MDIFEKCNQRYIQDEVRDLGIYPYFHALESRQDTEVIMEGKRRIMLGSNNYLGLTTNPKRRRGRYARPMRQFGSGCSGSRFLNGTLKLHLELEDGAGKISAQGRRRDLLDGLPVQSRHHQRHCRPA